MDKNNFFVHESSYIDESVEIEEGTKIWHFCHILKNTIIGKNCTIGQGCSIGPNVKIGNNVKIQNNNNIPDGLTLEDNVFIGPLIGFTNVKTPRSHWSRREEYKKTLVKEGGSIGANAVVICGITLGKYCLIGAGSLVTKNVPDYCLVYGNPASIGGWVCYCGIKLNFNDAGNAKCSLCEREYIKHELEVKMVKDGKYKDGRSLS
ncbi:MAG: acyltransferase [Nanoarchaeota archaeon]